jgi:hypothetical protein
MRGPRKPLPGFLRHSVWSPGNLDDIPERYRGLYRFVTPIKIALFAIFGLVGTEARVPAIDDTFGIGYGDFWTIAMFATSVVAFASAAFYPAAKRLEMVAVICMTMLMGIYALAVLIQALIAGDPDRLAFGVAVFIFLVFPTWIVVDLLYEVRPKEVVPAK